MVTRAHFQAWCLLAAVGGISSLIAVLVPNEYASSAGWFYIVLVIVIPLHNARSRARMATLDG